ncbi:MAG: hypothetical protein WBB01_20055 [Phormidesmis sp.]
MKIASQLRFCAYFALLAGLLTVGKPASSVTAPEVTAPKVASRVVKRAVTVPTVRPKTEAEQGTYLESDIDCDGDGIRNDASIDFDGDGVADSCVASPADIPEPPFEQTDIPTAAAFYALLPDVGSSTRYTCGDRPYEVTLSRPTADRLLFSADGLTLSSDIVYDDIDPNLNQPLVVRDPAQGLRYSFDQATGDEFYEYVLTNYGGDIGFYVYQTGEQVVADPCSLSKVQ